MYFPEAENLRPYTLGRSAAVRNGALIGLTYFLTGDPLATAAVFTTAKASEFLWSMGVGTTREGKFMDLLSTIGLVGVAHFPLASVGAYLGVKASQIVYNLFRELVPDKGKIIEWVKHERILMKRQGWEVPGSCGHSATLVHRFSGDVWHSHYAGDSWGVDGHHMMSVVPIGLRKKRAVIVDYTAKNPSKIVLAEIADIHNEPSIQKQFTRSTGATDWYAERIYENIFPKE